jgi:prepilin-type N-terminal cleavage/methylation domain-containing protein
MTYIVRYTTRPRVSVRGWTLVEMMVAILIISILAGLTLSIGSAVLASSETRRTDDALTLLDTALQEFAIVQGRTLSYGINGDPLVDTTMGRGSRYDIDLGLTLDDGQGCACGGGLDSVFDYRDDAWPSEAQLLCSQWCQVTGCTGSGPDNFEGVAALSMLRLQQLPASRDIIRAIQPDLLKQINVLTNDTQGEQVKSAVRPIDAWDNPILIVLPGRERVETDVVFDSADNTVRTKAERMLGSALARHAYFVSAGPDGKFGSFEYDSDEHDVASDEYTRYQQTLDNLYSYEVQRW